MWVKIADLGSGWRLMRQRPLLSLVAVLSLALAIGANTAVFSAWQAVMQSRLPVWQPDRLVAVFNQAPTVPGTGDMPVSHLDYLDYAAEPAIFSGSYALYQTPVALGTQGTAVQVTADVVSGSYFDVLGVRPALGAVFHASDTRADGSGALVVLSHDFFERHFAGRRAVVGSTLTLNHASFTVAGVAPAGFSGTNTLAAPDLWAPMSLHRVLLPGPRETYYMARNAQFFSVVARLQPGVTLAQARAAVRLTGERLARVYPKSDALLTATALPLLAAGIDPNQRPLFSLAFAVMLAVVGMVLLIACANIANLLLARAHARRQEMAVRMALGASRGRLMGQMLGESLLLGAAGGAAGLLLAEVAERELWAHRPAALAGAAIGLGLDGGVLAFTLGTALVTTLLFSLAPALLAARVEPQQALREREAGGRTRLWRSLLLAGEAGFSITVLILAGLFLSSLRHLQAASPGFDSAHVAALHFDLSATGFALGAPGAPARLISFERALLQRVRAMPGVASAALASGLPMAAMSEQRGYQRYEQAATVNQEMRVASIECISPGAFFRTMGIPLVEGRDFLPTDDAAAPRVMIVNQTLARMAWPGQDPIGKRILFHEETAPTTVVGVARDSAYESLTEGKVAFAYLPLAQEPDTALGLAVRSAGPPAAVMEEMRRAVEAANPTLAISKLQPAAAAIAQSLWAAHMGAMLLALLSALATLLAAIGLYGVAAYEVRQRWRELGIRVALGASRRRVFASVLRRGLTPVLLGLAAGVAAAIALGRLARALLFGVGPANPAIVLGYAALFVAIACCALAQPAWTAARADPAAILKEAL